MIDRALALIADPNVKQTWSDWDKHYGGSMTYFFETTDRETARKHEFECVRRAGEDDSEQIDWAQEVA